MNTRQTAVLIIKKRKHSKHYNNKVSLSSQTNFMFKVTNKEQKVRTDFRIKNGTLGVLNIQ